jgi:NADH-quinone oxidoreductase subunit C
MWRCATTRSRRVVYEPVEIEPRVLVPKVIRNDSRYLSETQARANPDAARERANA